MLLLPYSEPFHIKAMLAALETHAVNGVERADTMGRSHTRALRTPSGPAVVTIEFADGHVAIATSPEIEDKAWLAATVRRWLDLDARPEAVADALGGDPLIGPLLTARPGLRVLGYADAFEGAAMTIIGQQVSLAATRTFGSRLVAAFGTPIGNGFSVYPTAATLAASSPAAIQQAVGLTNSRSRTLVGLAKAVADGLSLEPTADPEPIRRALLALPGIGPWTVDYLSVRALGDRDAFAPGDLVLRRALRVTRPRDAAAMAQAWRPYRAYALFHLWTNEAYL